MTEQVVVKRELSLSIVKTDENSLRISWVPVINCNVDTYLIKYKLSNQKGSKWTILTCKYDESELTINGLVSNSTYEIKISADYDGDMVMQNRDTLKAQTEKSLARQLINGTERLVIDEQSPVIYKLNVKVTDLHGLSYIRTCEIHVPEKMIQKSFEHRRRSVLLIGETGTGKTTFIDGVFNYISGLKMEEDFRMRITDLLAEEEKRRANPASSQTIGITWYKIPQIRGSSVHFPLDIIDTPGFGDSQGVQRDREIMDLLKIFFCSCEQNQLHHIHFVCFVVKATSDRLTLQQKYVFQNVVSIFGKDVESNIVIIATHADSTIPRVLPALTKMGIASEKCFKFDNQSIETKKDFLKEHPWHLSEVNFEEFFKLLETLPPFKIEKTKNVLETRNKLTSTVQSLLNQVQVGVNAMANIKKQCRIIKTLELEIKCNEKFTWEEYEQTQNHVDCIKGKYAINCEVCGMTCHFPCTISKDNGISWCWAIHWRRGTCLICPKRCNWGNHKSQTYFIRNYYTKVIKTNEDLKEKYNIANEKVKDHSDLSKKAKREFKTMLLSVEENVEAIKQFVSVLNESALLPMSTVPADYIEMLIQQEENEHEVGWMERINLYKKLKKHDSFVQLVNNDNFKKSQLFASDESVDEFLEDD